MEAKLGARARRSVIELGGRDEERLLERGQCFAGVLTSGGGARGVVV
jgi:hypothetical protein